MTLKMFVKWSVFKINASKINKTIFFQNLSGASIQIFLVPMLKLLNALQMQSSYNPEPCHTQLLGLHSAKMLQTLGNLTNNLFYSLIFAGLGIMEYLIKLMEEQLIHEERTLFLVYITFSNPTLVLNMASFLCSA